MVDLRQETNLRWCHRVIIWQEELQVEDAAFVWGLCWAVDLDVEVAEVVFVRDGGDARYSVYTLLAGTHTKAQEGGEFDGAAY